jgi:two-component system, response regulator PdtaR
MNEAKPTVVLVVDDEGLLRMSAVDALADDGFIAIEARNATEALKILGDHPEISVLFTDIQMSGLDGLELAKIVYDRRPDIRLILTSGRLHTPDDEIPDHGRFISKPYGQHAVRDILNVTS